MTRKASLQQTADRMAELQKLFAKCLKLEPGWIANDPKLETADCYGARFGKLKVIPNRFRRKRRVRQ